MSRSRRHQKASTEGDWRKKEHIQRDGQREKGRKKVCLYERNKEEACACAYSGICVNSHVNEHVKMDNLGSNIYAGKAVTS